MGRENEARAMDLVSDRAAVLCVVLASGDVCVPFAPGPSLREILDTTEHRVQAACGGVGVCGRCLVRIEEGAIDPLTAAEIHRLSPAQQAAGVRLACQIRPRTSLRVRLLSPAPKSRWRSLPEYENVAIAPPRGVPSAARYGLAVDLGTTFIRVALWDLQAAKRVAARSGLNPQGAFGADVLSRLEAATESPARARAIAQAARDAIGEAFADIVTRHFLDPDEPRHGLGRALVVGNTAMLALLAQRHCHALLQPENWERAVDVTPVDDGAGQPCPAKSGWRG